MIKPHTFPSNTTPATTKSNFRSLIISKRTMIGRYACPYENSYYWNLSYPRPVWTSSHRSVYKFWSENFTCQCCFGHHRTWTGGRNEQSNDEEVIKKPLKNLYIVQFRCLVLRTLKSNSETHRTTNIVKRCWWWKQKLRVPINTAKRNPSNDGSFHQVEQIIKEF